MSEITITIDGKACKVKPGQTIAEAAKAHGIYIPTLCHYEGLRPVGSCRICTVRVGGRYMAACTQVATEGMVIENKAPDLEDMRRGIIEMLFVEGNHMCPTCEKSGNCELQALAYRYQIMAPRFPYQFPVRQVDASSPKIVFEHNRCIECQRCVRSVQTKDGRRIFVPLNRSRWRKIGVDPRLIAELTDEMARKAMDVCPVGAILRKEVGFAVPIGKRKFDKKPIGSDVEEGSAR
jgi:[NiFe] hydrogenase diaphorase moiety small subunit